ncbi:4494_t:CDS:2 [Ambispora gerdemannii]|uniref:4494_t:CDS:1 n=1 Tax=Ambispora gerdemannii TaxID=144530 RepID=A0A9N8WL82_9GLOM|nr:4494_t:CDS:2 [Ambispora gerdemannii]
MSNSKELVDEQEEPVTQSQKTSDNEINDSVSTGDAATPAVTSSQDNQGSENQDSEIDADKNPLSPEDDIWDESAQAYYYWNTVTNETTWHVPSSSSSELIDGGGEENGGGEGNNNENAVNINVSDQNLINNNYGTGDHNSDEEPLINPLDSLLDKIDNEVKSKLDGGSKFSSSEASDVTSTTETASPPSYTLNTTSTSSTTTSTTLPNYSSQYHYTDPSLSLTDHTAATTAENMSDYNAFIAQHGNSSTEYTLQARFNSRTGRFQRDPTLNPERFSADSKAVRQMSYFFDYEQFSLERGVKRLKQQGGGGGGGNGNGSEKSKKIGKRELEILKQRKKEKKEMKKRAWLMGDD